MNAISSTRTTSALPSLITAAPDHAAAGPAAQVFAQALQQARQDHRAAEARQQTRSHEAQVQDSRRQDARRLDAQRLESQRLDTQRREARLRASESLERLNRPSAAANGATGTPGATDTTGAAGPASAAKATARTPSASAAESGQDSDKPLNGPAAEDRAASSARERSAGDRHASATTQPVGDQTSRAAAMEHGSAKSGPSGQTGQSGQDGADGLDDAATPRSPQGTSAGAGDRTLTPAGHRSGVGGPAHTASSPGRWQSTARGAGIPASGGRSEPGAGRGLHEAMASSAAGMTGTGALPSTGSPHRAPVAQGMDGDRAAFNPVIAIDSGSWNPGFAVALHGVAAGDLQGGSTGPLMGEEVGGPPIGHPTGHPGDHPDRANVGPGGPIHGAALGTAKGQPVPDATDGPGRDPSDFASLVDQAPGRLEGPTPVDALTNPTPSDGSTPGTDLASAQAWAAATGAAGLPAGAAPEAAAATPAERSLPAPVRSDAFAPALGAQLQLLIQDGISEARLHLNPAEMGPISVRIQIEGQTAQVDMAARDAATRLVLEQAMPALAGALQDSGLTLTGGGVFEQSRQTAGDEGPRRQDPAWGGPGRNGSADALAPALTAARTVRLPQGAVDIYA